MFDPVNPISIIGFIHAFILAIDNDGVYKEAAMLLIPFFMMKSVAAALTAPSPLNSDYRLVASNVGFSHLTSRL